MDNSTIDLSFISRVCNLLKVDAYNIEKSGELSAIIEEINETKQVLSFVDQRAYEQAGQEDFDNSPYIEKLCDAINKSYAEQNCRFIALDLHSDNVYLAVMVNEFVENAGPRGKIIKKCRIPTTDGGVKLIETLERYCDGQPHICCVEATYNWYFIANAFEERGWNFVLADPCTVSQSKIKAANDQTDAVFLADRLRTRSLRYAYALPRVRREIRDLIRSRCRLVQLRASMKIIAINKVSNQFGIRLRATQLAKLIEDCGKHGVHAPAMRELIESPVVRRELGHYLRLAAFLEQEIVDLDETIQELCKDMPYVKELRKVVGCGPVLSVVIASEIGDTARFKGAGNFVSYCRLAPTAKLSNGKPKGMGNAKNGNAYLSWAFTELANIMIRHDKRAQAYYHRVSDEKQKLRVIAIRTMAAKLARSIYQCLTKNEAYSSARCFGGKAE